MDHEAFMARCLELASQGLGSVAPNPMVGSVVVHNGQIIGEGWHQKFGEAHAEVNAINAVPDSNLLKESTLYITLEPCSHHGKTPPCSDLILQTGIKRVVIANSDPNPLVLGGGLKRLHEAGVEVISGILSEETKELNKRFFTYHEKQRPYIMLKWAQSKDGFIGMEGKRVQISGDQAMERSHLWRTQEMAIIVGTNTARTDNPELTPRLATGRPPLRLVLDRESTLPDSLNLFDGSESTVVYTEIKKEPGVNLEYVRIPFDSNLLSGIMTHLEEVGVNSLLVEGGAQLLNAFIEEGLWDEARVITSPIELSQGIPAPEIDGYVHEEEDLGDDKLKIIRPNRNK
jgi:diaminohydroxyphosphoribosylaminopyrimidine deaminase/5-amino-6-(5-phosphoribosylamino)uracil reductase